MAARDSAKGLVIAAAESRRRANRLRASADDVRLDQESFAYAQMLDDLADWCDAKAAALYRTPPANRDGSHSPT